MANISLFKSQWQWKFRIGSVMIMLAFLAMIAIFWREIPNDSHTVFLIFSGLLFAIVLGVAIFFRVYLDTTLIRPLIALTRDVQTQSLIGNPIDPSNYNETMLGALVSAFLLDETKEVQLQSSEGRLAEVLHLIEQAIIITDPQYRIVMVNARAREMFPSQKALGLGRHLDQSMDIAPIKAARFRIEKDINAHSERIFVVVKSIGVVMPARVTLLRDDEGSVLAHVIGFNDHTNTLFQMSDLEREYENLLLASRDFAAQAQFASYNYKDVALQETSANFSKELHASRERSQEMIGNAWPKARIGLSVFSRLLDERLVNATVVDPVENVNLRADVSSLLTFMEMLTNGLHNNGHSQILVSFEVSHLEVKVIVKTAVKVDISLIENLMKTALTDIPTAPSANEILRFHGTEIWPHLEDAQSALVFILPCIRNELQFNAGRPDYYEFELPELSQNLAETPLRDMSIVVFDTETTGLDPKGGDKVVQISAVRVLRGKVLGAETFDQLVNPERNIPAASTKIHKITNEMVKDASVFMEVLHGFSEYSHGDVLLAHNAAFDMAFVRAGAKAAGLSFDQPVLDTVYMSAFLFDHTAKHTLDDLSKRLGVSIPEEARHAALGDAIATAEVFVRLIPLLEARGVNTLGQMLEVGAQMHKIRKAQALYS